MKRSRLRNPVDMVLDGKTPETDPLKSGVRGPQKAKRVAIKNLTALN
jgi:hypothetical protein